MSCGASPDDHDPDGVFRQCLRNGNFNALGWCCIVDLLPQTNDAKTSKKQETCDPNWTSHLFVAYHAFRRAARYNLYARFNLSTCLRFGIGCAPNVKEADTLLQHLKLAKFPMLTRLPSGQGIHNLEPVFVMNNPPNHKMVRCPWLLQKTSAESDSKSFVQPKVDVTGQSFVHAMALLSEVLGKHDAVLFCTRPSHSPNSLIFTAAIGGVQFGVEFPFASKTLATNMTWALTATATTKALREYSSAQFGGALTGPPEVQLHIKKATTVAELAISIRFNLDGNFEKPHTVWHLAGRQLGSIPIDEPFQVRKISEETPPVDASLEFQNFIRRGRFEEAHALFFHPGVVINCQRSLLPPPFVSCAHHLLTHGSESDVRLILPLIRAANGCDIKTLTTFHADQMHNAVMAAVCFPDAIEFLTELAGVPLQNIDWNQCSPTTNHTPLISSLITPDSIGTPTHANRDRLSATLVTMMSDDALNLVDACGTTAIWRAVYSMRIRTLDELLKRIPGVELEPNFIPKQWNCPVGANALTKQWNYPVGTSALPTRPGCSAPLSLESAIQSRRNAVVRVYSRHSSLIDTMLSTARQRLKTYFEQLPHAIDQHTHAKLPTQICILIASFLRRAN